MGLAQAIEGLTLHEHDPQTGAEPDISAEISQKLQRAFMPCNKTQSNASRSILSEADSHEAISGSTLLDTLAPEIQLQIYEELLAGQEYTIHTRYCHPGNDTKPDNRHVTAILKTCRLLRTEALPIFHKNVCVGVYHKEGIKSFRHRNWAMLDKAQLQHVVIASHHSHAPQARAAIDRMPKLQTVTFEVSGDPFDELARFIFPALLPKNSQNRPRKWIFFTKCLLSFCCGQFR